MVSRQLLVLCFDRKTSSRMSSPCQQNDAGKKFWQTPELIENLLPFLDFESTLKLAPSHPLTLKLLQIDSNWKKLIGRYRTRPWPRKWSLNLEIEEPLLSALSSILSQQKLSESLFTFSNVKIESMQSGLQDSCAQLPLVYIGNRSFWRHSNRGVGGSNTSN